MNLQQMIAVGVFLLVMAAIISEKVHRSVAALAGAVVLLLTHVLTIETAADYVDLNTIGVLVGMMLFVAVVKSSGLFEYIAIWSAKLTRGQPMAILAVFSVITAVLSAFLDNVTTVLLIGPMTIAITRSWRSIRCLFCSLRSWPPTSAVPLPSSVTRPTS